MASDTYFILQFSTFTGRRQSLRFHLSEPIDLFAMSEDERQAFILYALHRHGIGSADVRPDSQIFLRGFETEHDCRMVYDQIAKGPTAKDGIAPSPFHHTGWLRASGKLPPLKGKGEL